MEENCLEFSTSFSLFHSSKDIVFMLLFWTQHLIRIGWHFSRSLFLPLYTLLLLSPTYYCSPFLLHYQLEAISILFWLLFVSVFSSSLHSRVQGTWRGVSICVPSVLFLICVIHPTFPIFFLFCNFFWHYIFKISWHQVT